MNPTAKKCKFPQCSRHTRRTNEKCVLHRHYNLQSVLPLIDETGHDSNNLYLKKNIRTNSNRKNALTT